MPAVRPDSGDELLEVLAALASPHRLRILAALAAKRNYTSRLARDLGISRPLLHMHLQRLEAAGLVVGKLELSQDGKAVKYYEAVDPDLHLSLQVIEEAVRTLHSPEGGR